MALDVSELWTYVQMLAQRIEAENQEFAEVSERLRRG